MLVNLVPEFLAILDAPDRYGAWLKYRETHKPIIDAYWRNYVLDPDGPQAEAVVRAALAAPRDDFRALVARTDVAALAESAHEQAQPLLGIDRPTDVYVMVGMGAANAGELVVGGRGVAFVCLEHFTGRANPDTYGLGLSPSLIPLWVAHELAHAVRYTSPASRSSLRRLVKEQGGYYDYWETGRRATLRELLLNEGLAVHAAMAVAPGLEPETYFGFTSRQFQRLRETEPFLRRAAEPDLDRAGLGLRLRWLSGGMSTAARLVEDRVLPERSGYYLGWRMAQQALEHVPLAEALRMSAEELSAEVGPTLTTVAPQSA